MLRTALSVSAFRASIRRVALALPGGTEMVSTGRDLEPLDGDQEI